MDLHESAVRKYEAWERYFYNKHGEYPVRSEAYIAGYKDGSYHRTTPTGGEAEGKLKSVMLQLGEIGCDIAEFLDGKPQPTGEGEKCPKCVYYADENCTMMAMQGTARCSFKKRHGTGEGEKCLWCNGTGDVTPLGGGPFKENVCSSCHGTGKAGK